MKPVKQYIAVFLLLISSLFVVPKELIHELSFHDDTIDYAVSSNELTAVGNVHHHCDILQIFVPPYCFSNVEINFSEVTKLVSQYSFSTSVVSFEIVDFFSNRGPPVAISFC